MKPRIFIARSPYAETTGIALKGFSILAQGKRESRNATLGSSAQKYKPLIAKSRDSAV